MQPKFVADLHPIDKGNLVGNQCDLLRVCAEKDIPLFILEHTITTGGTIDEVSVAAEKVPRAKVIRKEENDGFFRTTLRADLKALGTRSVILTGINASFCVLDTAFSALRFGHRIITAENLIADGVPGVNLKKMRSWYKANGTFFPGSISFP